MSCWIEGNENTHPNFMPMRKDIPRYHNQDEVDQQKAQEEVEKAEEKLKPAPKRTRANNSKV